MIYNVSKIRTISRVPVTCSAVPIYWSLCPFWFTRCCVSSTVVYQSWPKMCLLISMSNFIMEWHWGSHTFYFLYFQTRTLRCWDDLLSYLLLRDWHSRCWIQFELGSNSRFYTPVYDLQSKAIHVSLLSQLACVLFQSMNFISCSCEAYIVLPMGLGTKQSINAWISSVIWPHSALPR